MDRARARGNPAAAGDPGPLSDDQLLELMAEVERRQALAGHALEAEPEDEEEEAAGLGKPSGDPCAHCGEPALAFDECLACGEEGCLPRDDWMPGWADPCLTRCARCGSHVHLGCAGVDAAGNFVCCGPRYAPDEADAYQ